MALTVGAPIKQGVFGDLQYAVVPITWDASYPTGGLALTPKDVGFRVDIFAAVLVGVPAAQATTLTGVSYDRTNQKLQAFGGDANSATVAVAGQIPNTTNISATIVNVLFLGK